MPPAGAGSGGGQRLRPCAAARALLVVFGVRRPDLHCRSAQRPAAAPGIPVRAGRGTLACLIAPRLQGGSATAGVEPAWRLVWQAPPWSEHGGLPAATAAILHARRRLYCCLAVRGARACAFPRMERQCSGGMRRQCIGLGCGVAERRCRCGRGRAARAALRAAVRGEAGYPVARGAGAVRMPYSTPIARRVGDGGSRARVALGSASAAVFSARWATDCPTSPFFMKRMPSYTLAFSIIRYIYAGACAAGAVARHKRGLPAAARERGRARGAFSHAL